MYRKWIKDQRQNEHLNATQSKWKECGTDLDVNVEHGVAAELDLKANSARTLRKESEIIRRIAVVAIPALDLKSVGTNNNDVGLLNSSTRIWVRS